MKTSDSHNTFPKDFSKSGPRPSQKKSKVALKTTRQDSLFWQCMNLLGSLQLALLLLAVIGVACAVATFTEAHFDSKIAHELIYKAPWFLAWLILLCINLFAVTVTRWPWRKKHLGFVITHYGIIILLIGAAIGLHVGYEGNVTLRVKGSPVQKITTNRSVLEVESPIDNALYLFPFDASVKKPSQEHPTQLSIPQTSLQLVINNWTSQIEQHPSLSPTPDGGKAGSVIVRLINSSSHQEQLVTLSEHQSGLSPHFDFFGLATIDLFSSPIAANQALTNSGGEDKDTQAADSFSASSSESSLAHGGGNTHFLPTDSSSSGITKSSRQPPWLHLFFDPKSHQLRYQRGRSTKLEEQGTWNRGNSLRLHWGEWEAKLVDAGEKELIAFEAIPADNPKQSPNLSPIPGIQAFLQEKQGKETERGKPVWIASGDVGTLQLGENLVHIGYGLEMKTVPFSIELLQFEIPRDEGTDRPGDFRAKVLFSDLRTGKKKEGLIHMNHPASFPGGWWANLTGYNYKFSQAEWNPQDLSETTLQVLYDPGWLLKWIGSLAITVGIALMFYFKPKSRSQKKEASLK